MGGQPPAVWLVTPCPGSGPQRLELVVFGGICYENYYDEEERMEDCTYDLVGESHYRDELQQLVDAAIAHGGLSVVGRNGWVRLGVACWLVPEPENAYDSEAVAVFAGDEKEPAFSFRVGYLPRGVGSEVNDWKRVLGMIVGRLDGPRRWGVKIDWYQ